MVVCVSLSGKRAGQVQLRHVHEKGHWWVVNMVYSCSSVCILGAEPRLGIVLFCRLPRSRRERRHQVLSGGIPTPSLYVITMSHLLNVFLLRWCILLVGGNRTRLGLVRVRRRAEQGRRHAQEREESVRALQALRRGQHPTGLHERRQHVYIRHRRRQGIHTDV